MQADSIKTGNCVEQEETLQRICPFRNINSIFNNDDSSGLEENSDVFEEEAEVTLQPELQDFVDNIVAYIAGAVGAKVGPRLQCPLCICKLFPTEEDIEKIQADTILITERDKGGLFLPSYFLIFICKITEKTVRKFESQGIRKMSKDKILNSVVLESQPNFFQNQNDTTFEESECNFNHEQKLVRSIAAEYLKIRLHHTAKQTTLKINPTTNRSSCTKQYLFDGK